MKIIEIVLAVGMAGFCSMPLVSPQSAEAATVNLIDGDTLSIDGVRIRIVEIDTPETFRSRCEDELALGLLAKQRLRELVDSGRVTYQPTGMDRYHRTLAKVFVETGAETINVGEALMKEGFALPYRPGREAKLYRLQAWCGPDAQLPY